MLAGLAADPVLGALVGSTTKHFRMKLPMGDDGPVSVSAVAIDVLEASLPEGRPVGTADGRPQRAPGCQRV